MRRRGPHEILSSCLPDYAVNIKMRIFVNCKPGRSSHQNDDDDNDDDDHGYGDVEDDSC